MYDRRHFIYLDGLRYCSHCYDELTSKVCSKCQGRIWRCSKDEKQIKWSGESIDLYWHERCYHCHKCQQILTEQGHYWHDDGEMYCAVCYDDLTAHKCLKCKQLIYRSSKKEKQISSSGAEGVTPKYWHDRCYKCWKCYKTLVGGRHVSTGNDSNAIYCPTCFDLLYSNECYSCKRPIQRYSRGEKQISSKGTGKDGKRFYHDACYTCCKCTRALVANGHHLVGDSDVYCNECYDLYCDLRCNKCNLLVFRYSENEKVRFISSVDIQFFFFNIFVL